MPWLPEARRRRRIRIANPSDGGLLYWLAKLYAFTFVGLGCIGFYALVGVYAWFAAHVPPLPDIARYADTAPGVTTLYGEDGTIIGELATETREIVPLSRVPKQLVDALISTEDRRFWVHGGIDLRGTLRAALTNISSGTVVQGGSTLTQQVAKSYLSSERSFTRKIREAIMARRLEARYSKREILALYLNQVYLGNGAYGVQAAARRYFDKDIWECDLGELALIAGLARAPSRDSPLVSLKAAKERRDTVLENMVATGAISDKDAKAAEAKPIEIHPRSDFFKEVTPYFAEHVRRELLKQYGQKGLYEGGLRVETTVVPTLDQLAQENVDFAARKLDKRQGWRGPEAHLDGRAAQALLEERQSQRYGDGPLDEGRLYLGLVTDVTAAGARVRIGKHEYPLPVENMRWASKFSKVDATNDVTIGAATEALKKGDVVWVKWAYKSVIPRFSDFAYNAEGDAVWLPEQSYKAPPKGPQVVSLEQTPRISASLYTFDHSSGYVLAMVGGDDFDQSEFNRVVQSCRQPGSSYKPIYYSLALDHGYSFETLWNDKPKAQIDPMTGEVWVPQNIDGTYGVQVTLEKALVWSKNPPSEEIFQTLGTNAISEWHKKLGFSTPLVPNDICYKKYCPSLALGASCVHTDDISRAFAVFARNGRPLETKYIRRVVDRRGRVLEDNTVWYDPLLSAGDTLDRIAATYGDDPAPIISPRTAWLTSTLLRRVVTQGHSAPIRATKIIAAGKTGTSSHTWDVWFIGFTSKWLTTAWLGDDLHERELGHKDASFMLSVPLWARYMYQAVGDMPLEEIPWERPPGVKKNDIGGPLKAGYPPPPQAGYDPAGHPYGPPAHPRLAVPPGTPATGIAEPADGR